jgi:type II secretory pathway component PulJ
MLNSLPHRWSTRRIQRGLSIVELMVGIAVGLFVVAGASLVTSSQLSDNRRMLVETQVQQDLRAAADIITRELRRAGYFGNDAARGVWYPTAGPIARNPRGTATPTVATASTTMFQYNRPGNFNDFGFRLNSGVIQTQINTGVWQDLTDSRTVVVTAFEIEPRFIQSTELPCRKACADGTASCWPKVSRREFHLTIQARSASDARVVRALESRVRLRNDLVDFRDAANPDQVCPL